MAATNEGESKHEEGRQSATGGRRRRRGHRAEKGGAPWDEDSDGEVEGDVYDGQRAEWRASESATFRCNCSARAA
uniref:Uncharacterized protein n=1 Tax=Oryza brachyantha TaxID=4533 RepID=J3MNT5_ORYBR